MGRAHWNNLRMADATRMNATTADLSERYLPPQPRYLPSGLRITNWDSACPWLKELAERPLADADALRRWLLDRSELDSLVSAESARRMVATACNTADADAEAAYLGYETEVMPRIKQACDGLDQRFLAHPQRQLLDEFWQVYDRDTELSVRLFREENLPLEAEEEKLAVAYGRTMGAMTVQFRGEERTLPAMAKYLESRDRGVREEVWRLCTQRRLQDATRLDSLFDQLYELRQRVAANAGFDNYRLFKHQEYGRFDYSADDCLALHAQIEKHVLPLARRMDEARRRQLELDPLRPWDLGVDPAGADLFEPFQDSAGQLRLGRELLGKVDTEFGQDLEWMAARGLLDLETRADKRPGGFLETFEDERVPFIFANSGTTHADVETLVHEGGHAVHALLARDLEPDSYRHSPIEFAEVASKGMEFMALEHLPSAYPEKEARRTRLRALEDCVHGFTWIATVDAFQHQIYSAGDTSAEQRAECWTRLRQRFGGTTDWSGLERERASEWHRQLHVFEVPFYYVEYALAELGALQLWLAYRREPAAAVAAYRRGLSLGGSRPLPQLFAAAGLRFDPTGELLAELVPELESEWLSLGGEGTE